MPDRPLLVTSDPELLDDLLRLCASAGVEARVAGDVGSARAHWAEAPIVVLGDELALSAMRSGLGRRDHLVLIGHDLEDEEVWERAGVLGAESVVHLPGAQGWLVDRLAAACRGVDASTRTVAVIGGRGGAGATTLACALAVTAAEQGVRTLLIDADPLGGGVDLVVGCEDVPGLRWPDLAASSGAISASALRSALPRSGRLRFLSWDRGVPQMIDGRAATAVLDAGQQAHELVVVDLPRRLDALSEVAATAADTVLLVVPAEVRAVAAAARVAATVGLLTSDLRVVTRGPAPSGLTPQVIAGRLGLPLGGALKAEPGLVRGLERGEAPAGSGRGPLADLARALLAELVTSPADGRPVARRTVARRRAA